MIITLDIHSTMTTHILLLVSTMFSAKNVKTQPTHAIVLKYGMHVIKVKTRTHQLALENVKPDSSDIDQKLKSLRSQAHST